MRPPPFLLALSAQAVSGQLQLNKKFKDNY